MSNLFRTIPAALFAGALGVCLMGASNDPITSADMNFAPNAMKALTQSIADAEAVQTAGATGGVKTFAASIQSDELSMGTQLASLADYYGIKVDTDLPKGNGDTAGFAKSQVAELNNLISIMNAERNGGNAAQLRTFADSALPILQKDLQAAQSLAK